MNNQTTPVQIIERPPAKSAYLRRRHWWIVFSFFIFVAAPMAGSAIYLWLVAHDQYASSVGFSVRKEQSSPGLEIFGGITELAGSSSASDSDILYEFIKSQEMVSLVDREVNLVEIWSKPDYDPIFAYRIGGTIEDLQEQWEWLVNVSYDTTNSLLEVRALAFEPEDAEKITKAILEFSTSVINELSDIARSDTLRHTSEELEKSVEFLKGARQNVTEFRNRNQIVDPESDLQSQATVLGSLQGRLADSLIEVELLLGSTRDDDPRLEQGRRRVEVIRNQIEEERRKLGLGADGDGDGVFATIVGEYERLIVEREIAEQAYASSFVSHENSLAEARRQSRYLAAHIKPTLAQKSEYPRRWVTFSLISMFLFTIWSVFVLVFLILKDRR